jgi:ABC-type branched-subunit amino acid transport system permease subunit
MHHSMSTDRHNNTKPINARVGGLRFATMSASLATTVVVVVLLTAAAMASGLESECGMTVEALREYEGKCESAELNSSFPHCGT